MLNCALLPPDGQTDYVLAGSRFAMARRSPRQSLRTALDWDSSIFSGAAPFAPIAKTQTYEKRLRWPSTCAFRRFKQLKSRLRAQKRA